LVWTVMALFPLLTGFISLYGGRAGPAPAVCLAESREWRGASASSKG
jgi:hypothetical protein